MCMQISAANDSAAFESRASKFLVTNRTLSYSAQVSANQKNLAPERMAHEQSYWYQFLVPETWAENLGRVPWALNTASVMLVMLTGPNF